MKNNEIRTNNLQRYELRENLSQDSKDMAIETLNLLREPLGNFLKKCLNHIIDGIIDSI